eukprot:CAMPEP_0119051760 /NCGR_PEP_ID=MMETSP1177-20130426/73272_1 /TAXON_ID=2985 /ORGANISM="Ochromonas sp, Strain CCMP1899" /LENGTH=303 /DNA_ID=CAMNT_0007031077 /DNA_START=619 /DNA_END=1527 /DNA_ORIENTATION=-
MRRGRRMPFQDRELHNWGDDGDDDGGDHDGDYDDDDDRDNDGDEDGDEDGDDGDNFQAASNKLHSFAQPTSQTTNNSDIELQRKPPPILVSGKVTFPGKLVVRNVRVDLATLYGLHYGSLLFNNPLHTSYTNASGEFSFVVPPSSDNVTCLVNFNYNGGSGVKNVISFSLMSDTNLNIIEIPLGLWNGTVLGGDGAPVGGVYITGRSQGSTRTSFSKSDINGNKNEISGYTSFESGKFGIGVMTELTVNPYVDIKIRPPYDSPWKSRDIDSLMINTSNQQTIILQLKPPPILVSGKVTFPGKL